jgi:hypothetical protein
MPKALALFVLTVSMALAPCFAYKWDHAEEEASREGNLVKDRAAILEKSINCFSEIGCYGQFASGSLRDFFSSFESELLSKDSNATLFSYDELFLMYAVSAQFYGDKSAAWAGLVGLMENALSIKDSLSRRNNPFAQDSAFAQSLALLANYTGVEDGFVELDVPRELKDAFRIVFEAIIVKHSRSRLVDIQRDSHGKSEFGLSYDFMEKACDRFFARYPQSAYGELIREYVPEGYAQANMDARRAEKKWFMFSMGLGGGVPFFGGENGETVDASFEFLFNGEIQIWRVLLGFGFAGGLGPKKTLWEGSDHEMEGDGFGFLMGQLEIFLGMAVYESKFVTFDVLAGIGVADYTMTDDPDYTIQAFGPQFGAQVDFKLPLTSFVDLFFRIRYFITLETAELYVPDTVLEKRPETRDFPDYGPVDGIRHSIAIIIGYSAGFSKSMLTEGMR